MFSLRTEYGILRVVPSKRYSRIVEMQAKTKEPSERRILVTGATGYLGGVCCARLAQRDDIRLLGIARREVSVPTPMTLWCGDISDASFVTRVIQEFRPTAVLHFGGRTNASTHLEHVTPTFSTNAAGTLNLLVALTEAGLGSRFINCASMEEIPRDDGRISSPLWVVQIGRQSIRRHVCQIVPTAVLFAPNVFRIWSRSPAAR